jgi:hypothetical protein
MLMLPTFGCYAGHISWREGMVPDNLPWPPHGAAPRRSVRVSAVEVWAGKEPNQKEITAKYWPRASREVVAALLESGLFTKVLDDRASDETDLTVTGRLSMTSSGCHWCLLLTGGILPVVPIHAQTSYELVVMDSANNLLGHVKASEKETAIYSALFFPYMPFAMLKHAAVYRARA